MSPPLHLAVALDGAGWHPAAWREPSARPADLLTADYWLDLAIVAERGLLDFLTIEDSFTLRANGSRDDARTGEVSGRLDAVLIADRIAPLTRNIGLIPTALVTHTEPFHISKAIATLDFVSTGRAGVRIQVTAGTQAAGHFGRRPALDLTTADLDTPQGRRENAELFDEASDVVEVIRRLWDSWEDDAEIRDATTGRFIDRDKLHYIDFEGPRFSVKGPSIVPRPPQGQPVVSALAHSSVPYRFAAAAADIVFVTPVDEADAGRIVEEIRAAQVAAGRAVDDVKVFADLVVFLDGEAESGADRKSRLDALLGRAYTSDALVHTGTAASLAEKMASFSTAGVAGFRLRPGALPDDLNLITEGLVPELQARGLFRSRYESDTLRGLLGLGRPENRYAHQSAGLTGEGVTA